MPSGWLDCYPRAVYTRRDLRNARANRRGKARFSEGTPTAMIPPQPAWKHVSLAIWQLGGPQGALHKTSRICYPYCLHAHFH
jgi:hypothetical protein